MGNLDCVWAEPVKSDSNPGKYYTVAEWKDGTHTCTCIAYAIAKNKGNPSHQCKHIIRVLTARAKSAFPNAQPIDFPNAQETVQILDKLRNHWIATGRPIHTFEPWVGHKSISGKEFCQVCGYVETWDGAHPVAIVDKVKVQKVAKIAVVKPVVKPVDPAAPLYRHAFVGKPSQERCENNGCGRMWTDVIHNRMIPVTCDYCQQIKFWDEVNNKATAVIPLCACGHNWANDHVTDGPLGWSSSHAHTCRRCNCKRYILAVAPVADSVAVTESVRTPRKISHLFEGNV